MMPTEENLTHSTPMADADAGSHQGGHEWSHQANTSSEWSNTTSTNTAPNWDTPAEWPEPSLNTIHSDWTTSPEADSTVHWKLPQASKGIGWNTPLNPNPPRSPSPDEDEDKYDSDDDYPGVNDANGNFTHVQDTFLRKTQQQYSRSAPMILEMVFCKRAPSGLIDDAKERICLTLVSAKSDPLTRREKRIARALTEGRIGVEQARVELHGVRACAEEAEFRRSCRTEEMFETEMRFLEVYRREHGAREDHVGSETGDGADDEVFLES